MIKTYSEVLEDNLITDIFEYLKNIFDKDVWSSSNGWDQNLVLNSANIITHTVNDKILYKKIKNSVEKTLKIDFEKEGLDFIASLYLWGGGSYITWHPDTLYPYNGTIYLNKEWNSNDGGIFLYRDNKTKSIIGIEPVYNFMVVNSSTELDPHSLHCVTCILPSVIKKRITIQWRTLPKNEEKKLMYR